MKIIFVDHFTMTPLKICLTGIVIYLMINNAFAQTYTDSVYTIYNDLFAKCYIEENMVVPNVDFIKLDDSIYCYKITQSDLKKVEAISDIVKMKKKEGIYSYNAFFFVKNDGIQLYIDEGGNVLLTTTLLECIKNAGSDSYFILSEIYYIGDEKSQNHAPVVIKVI